MIGVISLISTAQPSITSQQIRRAELAVTVSQLANVDQLPNQLTDGLCQPLRYQADYLGRAGLRFVVYEQTNETGILAFKGTSSLEQWLLFNLNLDLDPCRLGSDCGRVVDGFQNAYFDLRDAVLNATSNYPNIIITGHSLGAALATLAALSISYEQPNQQILGLYTFGSPKVGNVDFITTMTGRLNQTDFGRFVSTDFRSFWNQVDWVTRVPLGRQYKHLGPSIEIECLERNQCDSLQDLHRLQTYVTSLGKLWDEQKANQCIEW